MRLKVFLATVAFWLLAAPGTYLVFACGWGKDTNGSDAIPVALAGVIMGFFLTMLMYGAAIVGYVFLVA